MTGAAPAHNPPHESMPGGVHLGVAGAATLAVALVLAVLTDPGQISRLVAMAVVAGFAAALIPDWRYAAGSAAIGYLMHAGFLVSQSGELAWHGKESVWQIAVFTLAFWLGRGQRWMRAGQGQSW